MNSKTLSQNKTQKLLVAFFILAFLVWGSILIFRTSFIAIDGKRYFCLADDAMISMQYAWNFSHGLGLVWNAGERVQGYTNLLMTLLMSVSTFLWSRSAAVLSIQILGLVFMVVIAYLNMKIADHIYGENGNGQPQKVSIRILSFLFALFYYPLIYWSLMGMETGLLTILLLFAVLLAFDYKKSDASAHLFQISLCLGLAFLTRNDSLIFALLIWAYILWDMVSRKTSRSALVQLFSAIGLYSIFIIAEFLFQASYYGELLPNTYILKMTGMPLSDRLSNGLIFVAPFLVQIGLLLIPAAIGTFLQVRKEKLVLLALVLSSIGYQIYIGGDPWNYWRFLSPTVPLLGILFIDVVSTVASRGNTQTSSSRLLRWRSFDTQVSIIVLLGMFVANVNFLPEILFLDRPFYVSANQHNVNIAVALREITTRDATVGVFWAGAIPYFSERKGIDFLGKSDRYIAHLPPDLSGKVSALGIKSLPGHNKYDLNYSIKQLRPTYVQGLEWGSQDLTDWGKAIYVEVEYKGTDLFLLRDSPVVLWERVNRPSD